MRLSHQQFTRCLSARLLALLLLVSFGSAALAKPKPPEMRPLGWLGRHHIENQVAKVDALAREKLGMQVHGDQSDLELLQRIINKGLIKKEDRLMLQAMGAVLGNALQRELGMDWTEYEDRLGQSRALCVADTDHCLFPITMLSRRMEVGLLPNVKEVFDYCVELMTPYIPVDSYGNRR